LLRCQASADVWLRGARARAPDRFFGSFPKVGIVIPNAAVWLLPDFYELGNALNMVIDVPTILPHGTRIDTTSDGFLLWLPSCAPAPRPRRGPALPPMQLFLAGCLPVRAHTGVTAGPPPSPPTRLTLALGPPPAWNASSAACSCSLLGLAQRM
jgi:hypothetical protein